MMRRRMWAMVITVVLITTGSFIHAHLDGPPPGFSGAPGEGSCAVAGCHDTPPADSSGSVYVSARGSIPSDTVAIGLSVTGPLETEEYGFQVTVVDSLGSPVGTLLLSDTVETQLDTGTTGRLYVSHTDQGTEPDRHGRRWWGVRWWNSGDSVDALFIHLAAVAADGDGTAAGDAVFITVLRAPICLIDLLGYTVPGDVNTSGSVTAADIIYLGGYIFKGDVAPDPCPANGDVNCSGDVTSADMIYLVNYIFRGAVPPCDICQLVYNHIWICD